MFKSTNGGTSWSQSNSGLAATSVSALAIDPEDPNAIYGVVQGDVFKETRGSTGWAHGGMLAGWVIGLAIHPQDSNTLYAAAESSYRGGGGVFKSTDRGANWNPANSGLPALQSVPFSITPAYTVAFDPQDANTLYAGIVNFQNPGVYKSTNGGANWSAAAGSGLPKTWFAVISFVFDPRSASTVYAVLYDEWEDNAEDVHVGIYKSTDSGESWNAVNDGLPPTPWGYVWVNALTIDPKNPDTLYAATNNSGVFKSKNGGASWSPANSGLTEGISSLAIDPLNPNTLYAGTWDHGVFKSTDAGSTWNAVNSGLTTLSVRSLVMDPKDSTRLYAGTDGGGVFAITFVPDLVVTELRFDRTSVVSGGSFSVNITGPDLTTQTFFDVRFSGPGGSASQVALNWQKGTSASHNVSLDVAPGTWIVNGVRAHEAEADHTASFVPVSAAITVSR